MKFNDYDHANQGHETIDVEYFPLRKNEGLWKNWLLYFTFQKYRKTFKEGIIISLFYTPRGLSLDGIVQQKSPFYWYIKGFYTADQMLVSAVKMIFLRCCLEDSDSSFVVFLLTFIPIVDVSRVWGPTK